MMTSKLLTYTRSWKILFSAQTHKHVQPWHKTESSELKQLSFLDNKTRVRLFDFYNKLDKILQSFVTAWHRAQFGKTFGN